MPQLRNPNDMIHSASGGNARDSKAPLRRPQPRNAMGCQGVGYQVTKVACENNRCPLRFKDIGYPCDHSESE